MYNVSLLACKLPDVGDYPSQRFSSDKSSSDGKSARSVGSETSKIIAVSA